MCPGTLIFWSCRTLNEEIEISFAQHEINLMFEPSLWMNRVPAMVIISLFRSHSVTGSLRANTVSTETLFVVVPD